MFVNHYSQGLFSEKKVLWIARFYLFRLYNNNFRPTYKSTKKHIFFCCFKIQYGGFENFFENLQNWKIWIFSGGLPEFKFPDT